MRKSTYTTKYKKLIAGLRAARLESGITQVDLAKRLKRPQSFVAKYEQGERRLDVIEMLTVCDALGVDGFEILRSVWSE